MDGKLSNASCRIGGSAFRLASVARPEEFATLRRQLGTRVISPSLGNGTPVGVREYERIGWSLSKTSF